MNRQTWFIVAVVALVIAVVIVAYLVLWPEDAPIEATEPPAATEEPAEPGQAQ